MVFQENYSPQPKTQDSNILLQEQPKVLCESDFKSELLTISLLEKAGQKEKAQELRTALNEAFTRMQENKATVKLNGFERRLEFAVKHVGLSFEIRSIEDKIKSLNDTSNTNEWSEEDVRMVMSYLNSKYNSFSKEENNFTKAAAYLGDVTGITDNVNVLTNSNEVRRYQDTLLNKFFGEGKQYNDKIIQGFDNEKGNYLIETKDFEEILNTQNINTINSRALANYLAQGVEKQNGDVQTFFNKLLTKPFGPTLLKELKNLWNNSQDTIAQDILKNSKIGEEIISFINSPEKLFTLDSPIVIDLVIETNRENFETALLSFIDENKFNHDFREKTIQFLTEKGGECGPTANQIFEKIQQILDQNQSTIPEYDTYSTPFNQSKAPMSQSIQGFEIASLSGTNSGKIYSSKAIIDIHILQTLNKESSTHDIGKIEEILGKYTVNYLNGKPIVNSTYFFSKITPDEITQLLGELDEYMKDKGISCPEIIIGNETKRLDEIYNKLSERLIQNKEENMKKKINTMISNNASESEAFKNLSEEEKKKKIDEITNELFTKISGNSCLSTIIENINITLKLHGIPEIDEVNQEDIIAILRGKNDIDTLQLNSAKINGNISDEDAKKAGENLQRRKENLQTIEEANAQEFNHFIQQISDGKNGMEAMRELKHIVEERQILENGISGKSLQQNETILPNNSISYKDTQINYTPSSNGNITLDTGNKKIEISQDELKIVENNESALENLINFKNTLDELHIGKLWDFRNEIFNVLRSEYPILFNEGDDFLSQQETVIFLNSLLASVDLKAYNSPHINILKSNFWITNNISAFGGTNRENQTNGNTSIEQKFLNTFCPITNNGKFEAAKFRDAIS